MDSVTDATRTEAKRAYNQTEHPPMPGPVPVNQGRGESSSLGTLGSDSARTLFCDPKQHQRIDPNREHGPSGGLKPAQLSDFIGNQNLV